MPYIDPTTIERIKTLHPRNRQEAEDAYIEVCDTLNTTENYFLRITSAYRTFAQQQALYEQGRVKPGNIVTKAKAGLSNHNYGLSFDVAFVVNKKSLSYDMKHDNDKDGRRDWMEVVEVFKSYGYEWGGDWATFPDYPHFQKTFGFSVRELLKLHESGKVDANGYVIFPTS